MEEIFLLNSGQVQIADKHHLNNFIDYLFSNTDKHQENIFTKNNSFILNDDLRYNIFPYDNILDLIEKTSEYENGKFYADLTYVFFIIKVNGKVITNMFDYVNKNIFSNKQTNENTIEFNVPNDVLDLIVSNYFNNQKSNLIQYINNKIKGKTEGSNTLEVINYNMCNDQNLRDYVEKKIHYKVKEKDDFINDDLLIVSMSHLDQDDYQHVHRLFLETF